MQHTQLHETFESLLAADPDVMDRDDLAGAVAQLRVLRGWCDAVEVRDRPPFESTRRRRPLRVGRRAVYRWWANVIEGCAYGIRAGNGLRCDAFVRRRPRRWRNLSRAC